MDWATSWDIADKIGITIAIITALISILIQAIMWWKSRRDEQLVHLQLCHQLSGETIPLPSGIRRKNLSRAEVQGLLGVIPMQQMGQRYKLAYLSDKAFFECLEAAQINARIDTLNIVCNAEEWQQFNWSEFKAPPAASNT